MVFKAQVCCQYVTCGVIRCNAPTKLIAGIPAAENISAIQTIGLKNSHKVFCVQFNCETNL